MRHRPRDINLNVALGENPGMQTLYALGGLSTLDANQADMHARLGLTAIALDVPVLTLAELCRDHAPPVVHFLKIDCEGSELAVLAGADFATFRPWIVVVEATHPTTQEASARGMGAHT